MKKVLLAIALATATPLPVPLASGITEALKDVQSKANLEIQVAQTKVAAYAAGVEQTALYSVGKQDAKDWRISKDLKFVEHFEPSNVSGTSGR